MSTTGERASSRISVLMAAAFHNKTTPLLTSVMSPSFSAACTFLRHRCTASRTVSRSLPWYIRTRAEGHHCLNSRAQFWMSEAGQMTRWGLRLPPRLRSTPRNEMV